MQVCDAPQAWSSLKQSLAVHAAHVPSLGEESLGASFGDVSLASACVLAASDGVASSFVPPSFAGGCDELEHATTRAATTMIRMKHRYHARRRCSVTAPRISGRFSHHAPRNAGFRFSMNAVSASPKSADGRNAEFHAAT